MRRLDLDGLFEDTPAGRRRMAMTLYLLVGPPFVTALLLVARAELRLWGASVVGALCLSGLAWIAFLPLRRWSAIYPVAIVPIASCAVAFVASGDRAHGFLVVMGAPIAWTAVLFELPTALAAVATAVAAIAWIGFGREGVALGLASAALIAVIQGLVTFVAFARASRHRDAHLRSLERHFPFPDLVLSLDGRILSANDRALETYGYTRAELLAKNIRALRPPEDDALVGRQLASSLERGHLEFEAVHLKKDGTRIPVEVVSVQFAVGSKTFRHSMIRDISARKLADARLRDALAHERALIANIPDTIARFDRDGRFLDVRVGAAEELPSPADSVVGRLLTEVVPEDVGRRLMDALARALATGEMQRVEYRLPHRDGQRDFETRLTRAAQDEVLAIRRDVTALRTLEQHVHQADRNAALGALAAGVGHEINNPLTFLVGNVSYAIESIEQRGDPMLAETVTALREASAGALRIRDIVRDLQTFSRTTDPPDATSDLRAVTTACLRLIGNQIDARARLEQALGATPMVGGSPARLGQIVLNLMMSALHALPEGAASVHLLSIRTGEGPDGTAFLRIEDDGTPFAREELGHLFEPFHASRHTQRGSALGLMMAHAAVSALGGVIEIDPTRTRGAALTLRLPKAATATAVPAAVTESARAEARRVLIIDDEPLVGRAIARTIARLARGCETIVITDPREAVARVTGGERFDLILSDLMMPELSGMEVYEALHAYDAALADRIVFMSGGAFTDSAQRFLERVPNRRADKPLERGLLESLLRDDPRG